MKLQVKVSWIWDSVVKDPKFDLDRDQYRVAVAVVDNKPVFPFDIVYLNFDDELMNMGGRECRVLQDSNEHQLFLQATNGSIGMFHPKYCSLTPPKPKTVMVELRVEDVEWLSRMWNMPSIYVDKASRVGEACKKALGELK